MSCSAFESMGLVCKPWFACHQVKQTKQKNATTVNIPLLFGSKMENGLHM